jgi:predicted alpha/beta hydrolase family esterase
MKRVVIAHGWAVDAEWAWIPWLKHELEKEDCRVTTPSFPNSKEPILEEWLPVITEAVGEPGANTYLIGHSLGCQIVLRYLETVDVPIGGALFIAGGVYRRKRREGAPAWTESWGRTEMNLEHIHRVLPRSAAILSDNDPFFPLEETEREFQEFGASPIRIVHGMGHITAKDGIFELPKALEVFREISRLTVQG